MGNWPVACIEGAVETGGKDAAHVENEEMSNMPSNTDETPTVDLIPKAPPDPVADNRKLALVDPETVPEPTPGYRPMEGQRKWALRKVADEQRAEMMAFLEEIATLGPQVQIDLGPNTLDATQARALAGRARNARTGKLRAYYLFKYYEEIEDINNHDTMTAALRIFRRIDSAAEDDPSLRGRYDATVTFAAQRGAAVAAGIAASEKVAANKTEREKKNAEKLAAKAAQAAGATKAAVDGGSDEDTSENK